MENKKYILKKIWAEGISEYSTESPANEHLSLKRLNLLIGPNNNGKSRFLRKLFSTPTKALNICPGDQYKKTLLSLGDIIDHMRSSLSNWRDEWEVLVKAYDGECVEISELKEKLENFCRVGFNATNENYHSSGEGIVFNKIRQANRRDSLDEELKAIHEYSQTFDHFKRYYIPILRGMRPLERDKDLYSDRTIKDYFSESKIAPDSVVTGFDLYDLLVSNLLGQPADRERIVEYEKFLGAEFFSGAKTTLIPEYQKDTVSVKIGTDDQFPIFNLGDGLQQVIIITSAAFLERRPSLFFIEEPENGLHPGLLRKLAFFLLTHTEHQYFVTTHSNHLLDLAETHDSVAIHRFQKVRKGSDVSFKISECTRDQDLLNELGALPSSVFLSNSTVWVEGITDRLYIKVFMRKYLDSLPDIEMHNRYIGLLENLHYSFVEYQGGTLGHWHFGGTETVEKLSASSVCANAFLIADGDIDGKSDRVELLRTQLGERFHLLPCKEIENLLPKQITLATAKRIFKRKRASTIEDLDIGKLDSFMSKNIEESKWGIGYHLDKCLGLEGKGKTRKVFAEESGTIADKVKFCREACAVMENDDWELPTHLKALCARIYLHIYLNQNNSDSEP